MKKSLILVLSVVLLTFVFSGCDAEIRKNIVGFMDNVSGNVYLDNNIVEANTADAQAVVNAIASIGTGAGQQAVDGGGTDVLGISVTVTTTTTLKPQDEAGQEALRESLLNSLQTKSNREALKKNLSATAGDDQQEAAKGSVEVLNKTLKELEDVLKTENPDLAQALSELTLPEIEGDEDLTKGDVLLLQMMTNLLKNTYDALADAAGGGDKLDTLDANALKSGTAKQKVESIVKDALLAARLAEELSGAASIDFSGKLDFGALLGEDNKGARTSRDSGDEIGSEAADILNSIMPDIVKLMGITRTDDVYSYTESAYQSFLLNQRIYRSSIEHAIKMAEQADITLTTQNAEFDTSTLIKYALAVLVTEHHAYWEENKDDNSQRPEEIIVIILDTYPALGKGTLTADFKFDEISEITFPYDEMPAFLNNLGTNYFKNLLNNLLAINAINGIVQLNEALDIEDSEIDDWLGNL